MTENGKVGLITAKGQIVVPTKYDNLIFFTDGGAKMELDMKWGLLNETMQVVAMPKYDDISGFKNDFSPEIVIKWSGSTRILVSLNSRE